MTTLSSSLAGWVLGGALVASLGWNATLLSQGSPGQDESARNAAPATACSGEGSCVEALDALADLGLTDATRAEVSELLRKCDEDCARGDARASELSRELMTLLRDPAADPATIRARAAELGALRAAAVESCAESSLALRSRLTPEQLGRLLDACCGGGSGCGGAR